MTVAGIRVKRICALIAALTVIAAVLCGCGSGDKKPEASQPQPAIDRATGLFSWDETVIEGDKRAELYKMLSVLGIDELYQSFEGLDHDRDAVKVFARDMAMLGVDLYRLAGDADWAFEEGLDELLSCVRETAAWSESWGVPLGIMLDIEPYADDARWDEDEETALRSMVGNLREAYAEAAELGIKLKVCIPTWYERVSPGLTEELIAECCHSAAVMNYDRTNEAENMVFEVDAARKHGKEIICIFEFQQVGRHELTTEQTYNEAGIAAAIDSFNALYSALDYDGIGFAYHYFTPMVDILEDYALGEDRNA